MKWLIPVIAIMVLGLMVAWMAGSFDEKVEPGRQELSMSEPDMSSVFAVELKSVEVFEVKGGNLNIQAIELRLQANKGKPL